MSPTDGSMTISDTTFGSIVQSNCDSGFECVEHCGPRVCGDQGWSGDIAVCKG